MGGRSANLRRGAVVAGVLLLVVVLAGCDIKARRTASGATRQVWVTDAAPSVTVELLGSETATSALQTGTTDAKGAYVFYDVDPATDYWIRTPGNAPYATARKVLGVMAELDQNPSATDYDDWVQDPAPADTAEPSVSTVVTPGMTPSGAPLSRFGYLPMRDATRLAVSAMAPPGTCTAFGQTDCIRRPTIAVVSMYDLAMTAGPGIVGIEATARDLVALGYVVVGVQLRGTHCSGGAWDGTGRTLATDGYDIVEMLARQPFSTGSVATLGFSGPAFHQLPVGAARPPHLTGMVMGGATDFYDLYYPGGMDAFGAGGFNQTAWLDNIAVQAAAKPATGTGSVATTKSAIGSRADGPGSATATSFASTCTENQELHLQHSMGRVGGTQHTAIDEPLLLGTAGLLRTPGSGRIPMDQTSLADRAGRVQVPVLISSTWQDDAAMGAASFAQLFTASPAVYGLYANGEHEMPALDANFPPLAGDANPADTVAVDLHRFLNLYVARMPLSWDGSTQATLHGEATPSAVATAQSTAAQRPVTVAWDRVQDRSKAPVVTHHTGLPGGATTPSGTSPVRVYLQGDGSLGFTAPTVADGATGSTVAYTEVAPSPIRGPQNGSGTWVRPASGAAATFTSTAVSADFGAWIYGPLSADLWIKSSTADARLQVTFTELRADGTEVFLQTGWRRASRRQLDSRSTELMPLPTGTTSQPLTPGTWTSVRVPLPTLAQVLELGSKLRITISAPGGDAPGAAFDSAPASTVTVGTSATRPSSLVFSWVTEDPPNDHSLSTRLALWNEMSTRRGPAGVACSVPASGTADRWWNTNQPCRYGG